MFKIFFKAPQPLACDGDVNLEAKKHALTVDGDSEEKGKRSNLRFTNGAHTFSGGGDVEAKRQKI